MTDNGMSPADYAAITGNNRGNGGFGYDGGLEWIIILFLFGLFGGWGGNRGFNGGGSGTEGLYPWLNNSNQINDGFREQMLNDNIISIRDGVYGLADMQQMFGLSQQLSQCCCDNRLATCQTQNMVQNEGNATRFANANNTRDIIQSQTQNTQAILDKLCQLELDGVKAELAQAQRENVGLQNQLNMATMRESQTAQNAFISQGFANEVDQLYNRLSNCPVPTTPVYGRTPIFSCNGNQGCGCNCGA